MARRLLTTGTIGYLHEEQPESAAYANALVSPGYPVFLAGVYALAGGADAPAQPTTSMAQAAISGLTLWAVYLSATKISGKRAGLTATVLGAAYIPHWWSYRMVLTEDLFACLCTWSLYALIAALESRRPSHAALFGALLSLSAYTRAAVLAWALLALLVLLWSKRDCLRSLVPLMLIASLACVALQAPWWIRNVQVYDRFVPFSSLGSIGLLVSTFDDFDEFTQFADHDLPINPKSPSEELSIDTRAGDIARDRIRTALAEEPIGETLARLRQAAVSVLTFDPNPVKGFAGIGGLALLSHVGSLMLAAIGAIRARHRLCVALVTAFPVSQILFYGMTLILSRYLMPSVPFLLILASFALYPRSSGSPMRPSTADAAATAGPHR